MAEIALIDENGWVTGRVLTECNHEVKPYSAARSVTLTPGDPRIPKASLAIFHDGTKFCQVKDPRKIWKRLRASGFSGEFCRSALDNHRSEIHERFIEAPQTAIIGSPRPVCRIFNPRFLGEVKNHVQVGISSEDQLDVWENELNLSGLYPDQENWIRAAEWLSDPNTWPIVATWKDEILQVERYKITPGNPTVYCGFTTHIDKERPHWLWQQLARPVFKSLQYVGIGQIESRIRADRPDWAESLRNSYGADLIEGQPGESTLLRYPIKTSLQFMPEWPYKRTTADWSWTDGSITVREGSESDFADIKQWAKETKGVWSSKDKLPKMLEKWIEIDNATVLLAIKDGAILDIWLVRPRGSTLSGVVSLGFNPESPLDLIRPGMHKWQKDHGYDKSSFFIKKSLKDMPVVKGLLGKGWSEEKEHTHFDHPMTEYKFSL